MNRFEQFIMNFKGTGLYSFDINTIQVNLGLRCNQECTHCHLAASPSRIEMMEWENMELILESAGSMRCQLVDLTGGAPELNPHFKPFVEALRRNGHCVQVRTNLSVLFEPGMETILGFFRDHEVQLVASLPCYLEENVRAQRGEGVYEKSIDIVKRLNSLGYGSDPRLALNLVYNPVGPFLPPEQSKLEEDYRRELGERFDITFSRLLTITNMPMGRFCDELRKIDKEHDYKRLLQESFNPQTLDNLMCLNQISVGWDGRLYDCDFNLALGLPVDHGAPNHIRHFEPSTLIRRKIVTGEHCFGCTAGFGSSCGGALTSG